jgi:T4-like virus tail tube protein gp19
VSSSGDKWPDNVPPRQPLLNARFRIEIEGLPGTGATEVIFPEARIVGLRGKTRTVQYGTLTIRRGMTTSSDWYQWWDRARRSAAAARKEVSVVVMDGVRADVTRWTFASALPSAYSVSPLNALGSEPLIETLELSVGGLTMAFGLNTGGGRVAP